MYRYLSDAQVLLSTKAWKPLYIFYMLETWKVNHQRNRFILMWKVYIQMRDQHYNWQRCSICGDVSYVNAFLSSLPYQTRPRVLILTTSYSMYIHETCIFALAILLFFTAVSRICFYIPVSCYNRIHKTIES